MSNFDLAVKVLILCNERHSLQLDIIDTIRSNKEIVKRLTESIIKKSRK